MCTGVHHGKGGGGLRQTRMEAKRGRCSDTTRVGSPNTQRCNRDGKPAVAAAEGYRCWMVPFALQGTGLQSNNSQNTKLYSDIARGAVC